MPTYAKFALIIIALAGGFFASDIFNWYHSTNKPIALDDYCPMTTETCEQNGIAIRADKDISHALVPTNVEVNWPTETSEPLLMTLKGYEMEMGTVVVKLKPNQAGRFVGQMVLPVCAAGKMTWYGTVSDGKQSLNASVRMQP